MNTFTKSAIAAAALVVSSAASAAPIMLDLTAFGGNQHDAARLIGTSDANSITSMFTEFGFTQMFATSVYDLTDGSLFGSFYDTNIASELAAAGVPTSGLSMAGTPISLVNPICPSQCNIDTLEPIDLFFGDDEAFRQKWGFKVEYHFDGVLTTNGPTYTGGYFNVFFDSYINDNLSGLAFSGALTGSKLEEGNLDLFFDITYAASGFLKISNDGGISYKDAAASIAGGGVPKLVLDTNVNPPIPTANKLLVVGTNAIRQTTLDGTVTASIPEPSSIAMLGLGLLGLGFSARRKS